MKFRRPSPPPYLNRRHQMRMLGMVFALALTVFAITVVGKPGFWAPLFPEEPAAKEDAEPKGDPTVRPDGPRIDAENVPKDDVAKKDAGDEKEPNVEIEATALTFEAEPPREWFAEVEDDSLGIAKGESRAYYGLLSMAASATLDEMEAASEDQPSRSLLMHEAAYFRGRLVTIEGELKRLTPMTVAEPLREKYGIDGLWDAWISTPDDPQRPLHVTFVTVADEVPRGMSIGRRAKVRVTGWFLKRQAFQGMDKDGNKEITRTPLLLAREPRYIRPPVVQGDGRELTPYVIGFAVVVGLALAALLLVYRASDRRFGDDHVRQFNEAPEGAIESLSDIETNDPRALLRELAERDAESSG